MATMARWNGRSFSVGPKRITPITGFSTSYEMKQDVNDDTSGTAKTNTRGRAPEEPTFSVKYLAAAGASPRTEFEGWRDMVGKKDYLYIGSTRYGEYKFELKSANITEVLFDNQGRTIQAVVTLKFMEDLPTLNSSNSSNGTSAASSSGKLTTPTKTTAKVTTAAKNQAMSAKASSDDKKLKNPYGTNRKAGR